MADEVLLNQNIQLLTQALIALNRDMLSHTGGRSSVIGSGNLHGVGTSGEDKNTIKSIATNTLLNATMKSNTDTVKYLIKDSKKNMQDLGKYTTLAGKYFADSIKNLSVKQLDVVIPKKLTESLNKSLGVGVIPKLKSYEDVLRIQTRAQLENVNAAMRLGKAFYDAVGNIKEQNAILTQLEKTGYDLNDYGKAVRDDGKALREHAGQLSQALANTAAQQQSAQQNWSKMETALKAAGAALLGFGAIELKAAMQAMKYGTEVTLRTADQAFRAGMTTETLIKTQNENIQAIHSSGKTFGEFNEMLDDGAIKLFKYTGNLEDGAKITASSFDAFRSLSNQTDQQTGFLEQQQSVFERMNRTIGMTSEEFTSLNSELLNNSNVQASMYKIGAKQRVALLQSLQYEYEKLKLDGLSTQQAKALIDSQAQLIGGKAQDRLVKAAKVQGIFGALGMGKDGQRLAEIIRMGNRGTPAEIAARSKEGLEIRKNAERQISQRYGNSTYAAEMMVDKLTEVIPDVIGTASASAALATSQGKESTAGEADKNAKLDALPGLGDISKPVILNILKVGQMAEAAGVNVSGTLTKLFEGYLGAKFLVYLKNIIAGARTIAPAAAAATTTAEVLGGGALVAGVVAAAPLVIAGLTTAALGYGAYKIATSDPGPGRARANPEAQARAADVYRASKIKEDQNAEINGQAQTDNTKHLADLTEQVKKLTDIQQKQLDVSKNLASVTQQGIIQQAAQTDDHINVTRKIIEQRDTRHAPKIQ